MSESTPSRLSQLGTLWSLVQRAHQGHSCEHIAARRQLLERYCRPVYRYLLGALRDAEAAGDLAQELAVRFLRGDFHHVSSQRGRFRDYLKRVLSNLVARHHRNARRQPLPLPAAEIASVPEPEVGQADAAFLGAWREELLNRTWAALARLQEQTGRPVYLVLRLGFEHPQMRSPEMAEALTRVLGKPVTAMGVRQALHRAREQFAALLLEEVAQTLEDPTGERLTEELIELDLLRYCGAALRRSGRCGGL